MITNALRGKQYTTSAKQWAVMVHDMAYENGEYAYQVERVLRYLRAKEDDTFKALTIRNIKAGLSTLDALYEAATTILSERKEGK